MVDIAKINEHHIQRCFAQVHIRTGKAWNDSLKRLPISTKKVGTDVNGFTVFRLSAEGKPFSAEVAMPVLVCMVGAWMVSCHRLELDRAVERRAFLMALDEPSFRSGLAAAQDMSQKLRQVVEFDALLEV